MGQGVRPKGGGGGRWRQRGRSCFVTDPLFATTSPKGRCNCTCDFSFCFSLFPDSFWLLAIFHLVSQTCFETVTLLNFTYYLRDISSVVKLIATIGEGCLEHSNFPFQLHFVLSRFCLHLREEQCDACEGMWFLFFLLTNPPALLLLLSPAPPARAFVIKCKKSQCSH